MGVAALFVDSGGVYPKLLGAKRCWDAARDARRYAGPDPVVAHPPCNLWVKFAAINYARWGGEHNRPGSDGGCFASALSNVRSFGGVLEHPANSLAWAHHNLAKPTGIGWIQKSPTEWVCEVWQSAYGHKARKRTWLLYASPQQVPPISAKWERHPGTHQIGYHDQRGKAANKPTVSKKEAIHTPTEFAMFLIALASQSRGK